MAAIPRVSRAVQQLKHVFTHAPATTLTLSDVERISGLDSVACERILAAFEDARFLKRGPHGYYRLIDPS
jgi:DNA-binding IclR family transcriptional regulator